MRRSKNRDDITTINALTYGKLPVKLTMILSGSGNIIYGQIIKGLIFFGYQCMTWYIFFTFGWTYLRDVNTLGTREMGRVFNEQHQIYVNVLGDNSLQILLFSIFAIAVLVLGAVVQAASMKSCYAAELDRGNGRRPSAFIQDLRNMFDKNMHTTMLVPPAAGVIAFTVLPILFMILLAFTNFDRTRQPPGNLFTWVGFENFANVFDFSGFLGSTFIRVLGWTLVWAFFATFLNYILGMIVALMINKKGIRLKSLWRTCFVIAIAVPGFVTLLFMRQLLGDMGPVNTILQSIGLSPVQFLRDPLLARITVITVNLWIGIPYTMLITSGVLMNIPADLYEAAKIDGAGPVRQYRTITLPYMLIVTAPYLITQFIANINNFNAIYFLTAGGPAAVDYYNAGRTDLLITWLYSLTVTHGDFNLASVIGIMTFMISAAIALVTFNITASAKREETFR